MKVTCTTSTVTPDPVTKFVPFVVGNSYEVVACAGGDFVKDEGGHKHFLGRTKVVTFGKGLTVEVARFN